MKYKTNHISTSFLVDNSFSLKVASKETLENVPFNELYMNFRPFDGSHKEVIAKINLSIQFIMLHLR